MQLNTHINALFVSNCILYKFVNNDRKSYGVIENICLISPGKTEMQHKLDASMLEVNSKYHQLEETEKNSLRSALIEERSRFCLFITCLKPFVVSIQMEPDGACYCKGIRYCLVN